MKLNVCVCVCETEFGSLMYFCGDNDQLEGFSDDSHVKKK